MDRELTTVRKLAANELERRDAGDVARERAGEVLAASELTYLLRLFAAFESGLVVLGPSLRTPRVFRTSDGFKVKLDQLGVDSHFPQPFRDEVDRDLRELRNELAHGRSLIPRLPFVHVMELMKQFIRRLT